MVSFEYKIITTDKSFWKGMDKTDIEPILTEMGTGFRRSIINNGRRYDHQSTIFFQKRTFLKVMEGMDKSGLGSGIIGGKNRSWFVNGKGVFHVVLSYE